MKEVTNIQALDELYKASAMAQLTSHQHKSLHDLAMQLKRFIDETEATTSDVEPKMETVED
jgi:predicted lipoprotein